MKFLDRLLTIVVTATLTSAVWIVAGGSLMENATGISQREAARPADAAPSPTPTSVTPEGSIGAGAGESGGAVAPPLDSNDVSTPTADERAQLLIPVLNVRATDLTDTYRDERAGGERLHEAIDIMAPEGTSVIAAASGVVEKLFSSDAGGTTIYVRSGDRQTIHYYAHLSEYAPGLKEGMRVRRGQRLGTVGSTGNADPEAPHLHFAILRTTEDAQWWEPANAVNPYPLLTNRSR